MVNFVYLSEWKTLNMYGQIVLEKFYPNLTFNNSMWEYLFFYVLINSGYYQSFKIFANLTGFFF